MITKLFDKITILVDKITILAVIVGYLTASINFALAIFGTGDTSEYGQWGMIFMIGAWVCVLQIRIDNLTK